MRNRTRLSLRLARIRRGAIAPVVVAITVAVLTGSVAAALVGDAARAAARYGDEMAVVVVTHDVAAGEIVTDDAVAIERRPRAFRPADAATLEETAGAVALAALVPGEVVVRSRLAADLVPPGWRALAVAEPGVGGHPDVRPGDAVEVLDIGDGVAVPEVASTDAVVVATADDGAVTVAVPAEHAPRVAFAAAAGRAVLAVVRRSR